MKIVSACLCGMNCMWSGKNKLNPEILEMVKNGHAIPVCPEQMGGLMTPRPPCEQQKDGRVISNTGEDRTKEFGKGAQETLNLAIAVGADEFIGKAKSPSCGVGMVYDGTFSGTLISGNGVTAELFIKNNIKVRSI